MYWHSVFDSMLSSKGYVLLLPTMIKGSREENLNQWGHMQAGLLWCQAWVPSSPQFGFSKLFYSIRASSVVGGMEPISGKPNLLLASYSVILPKLLQWLAFYSIRVSTVVGGMGQFMEAKFHSWLVTVYFCQILTKLLQWFPNFGQLEL